MATQPKQAAKASIKAIRVRSCSPQGTFRRGGEAFEREARTIPLKDLKKEQIEAIRKEPMLVVEDVEIEAAPDADQVDPETT